MAWLELDWDEAAGGGSVTNHLADGTELLTMFGRYVDDQNHEPKGLFVGGAFPDVSADSSAQNESGISFRDARGWHHVWCNVNEAIYFVETSRISYPGDWKFLGSRVIIRDRKRIVIESSHELSMGRSKIHMSRFAYFRSGAPWFRLGIRLMNVGDEPFEYHYVYGDDPWVGTFGRGDANVGWIEGRIVKDVEEVDTRRNRWAGMIDERSGIANVISWTGDDLPDLAYFSNEPGMVDRDLGRPLSSNTPFIGLEWKKRVLKPGESRSMLLSIGLAAKDPKTGLPTVPAGLTE